MVCLDSYSKKGYRQLLSYYLSRLGLEPAIFVFSRKQSITLSDSYRYMNPFSKYAWFNPPGGPVNYHPTLIKSDQNVNKAAFSIKFHKDPRPGRGLV